MGAFGTGFLGSIGDAVHQKAALARANEQKQKDMEAQYHWGALQQQIKNGGQVDPKTGQFVPYTPEDIQGMVKTATDNMAKSYGGSKPVKEIMQRTQQLIGKAMGHSLWGHPGSENLPPSQGGANPAAPETGTVAHASGGTIPAPPGLQSQSTPPAAGLDSSSASDSPAAANMLGSGSASDAAPAVSSPTSALASASQGLSDGKSADVSLQEARGPSGAEILPPMSRGSDASQATAPQPANPGAAAQSVLPQSRQLSPQTGSNNPNALPQMQQPQGPNASSGLQSNTPSGVDVSSLPSIAPQSSSISPAVPRGAIPPPPVSAPPNYQNMLSSVISPYAAQQLQAQQTLRQQQATFDQQQAQLKQHLANLAEAKGGPLTPTETMLAAGVKIPAGMLVPHYNSKVVLAENAAQNGRMIDGSSPTDHPGQVLQQIGQGSDGIPVYNTVNMPYQKQVIDNQLHAINPYTHEDIGAISQEPVKAPTSSSTTPSVRYLGADNLWHISTGARSTSTQTGHAPLAAPVVGSSSIQPPPSPLASSAPATVAAAAAAAQPSKASRGGSGTASASAKRSGGNLAGITLPDGAIPAQQLAQQQNRNTAINVAGQGLTQFVTPQEDGISNLDIFKDPAAVDRIANYMSLADNKLEGDWDEAEKGGSTGILKFYAGLPQAYTSIQIGAIKDAYDKLTPRDKRFVADFTSLMGQWGGARKGTGASASLYNFKNMSKEIPNPVYVKSYEDAVSRSRNMLNELNKMGEHNGTAATYDKDKILPKAAKKGTAISPPPGGAQPATVYAWDLKGNRHSAPAGTPLPQGWTSVKPQ